MTGQDTGVPQAPWFRRLFRRRTNRPMMEALSPVLAARFDALDRGLAALGEQLPGNPPDLEALQDAVANVANQISRAGREQFKANTLVEAQREQLTAVLAQSQTAKAHWEAELAAWPARCREAEAAARLDVLQRLLPALDGLDEAIQAGDALLSRAAAPSEPPPGRPFPAWPFGKRESTVRPEAEQPAVALREAMHSWLLGLTFVRQRLLDVLAAEGIQPIEAQGQPFDPHQHVVLETTPATDAQPAGTVVAELRRGYHVGERVLRYAEVTVATDALRNQSREGAA